VTRSISIFDEDIFEVLEAIEGSSWRKSAEIPLKGLAEDALPQTSNLMGLRAHVRKLQESLRAAGEEDLTPYKDEVVALLYGDGGWSRYQVFLTGELSYIRGTASAEKEQRILARSFRSGG